MNGLYIIPILAFLILIHEIGHFVTARMVGVTVEEFGIGIPPRLKGWTRNGVIWSINWIPLGGFVRVKGEDGADMEPGSMNTKGPWQRAFFLVAGSAMNLIFAVLLMVLLVGVQGLPVTNAYVADIAAGSPAEQAGWLPGDRIVEVAGHDVDSTEDIVGTTDDFSGRPMSVVLDRNGQRIESTVEPREDPPAGQGPVGIALTDDERAHVEVTSVAADSAGAAAGLEAGDRFVAINGNQVLDRFSLGRALDAAQGTTVTVTVSHEGEPNRDVQLAVPIAGLEVEDLEAGLPAATAGWERGDRLTTIDGKPITDPSVFIDAITANPGKTLPVTIIRNGAEQQTTLTVPALQPEQTVPDALGFAVVRPDRYAVMGIDGKVIPIFENVPASQVIPRGFSEAWDRTQAMARGIKELFTSTDQWDQVAGPIGMGQITQEVLDDSPLPRWVSLAELSIVLSLNLAILNLLPLPALDGGRLFFVIIELLRGGRRIAPEKEGVVHLVGLLLLLGFMFVVAFFDVNRIVSGDSFLP